jgi:hypothetical protein
VSQLILIGRKLIKFVNLLSFKTKTGYSSRVFLYYKEQCGTNVASLQLIDYEEDALRMLEKSQEEREIRILVTKSQEDQMQCEITPIKRRRHEEVSEEGIQDEDLDAYKLWLKKLPQDVDNPGTMY